MKEICFLVTLLLSVSLLGQEKTENNTILKKNKINITGIPIINYNESYGVVIGANSMAFFNMSKNDTISPSSSAGLGGGYAENRSWFVSAFTQLYIDEDRWRTTAAVGLGDINFQYFEATNGEEEGSFVDYSNVTQFAFLRVMRQIIPHFYGGVLTKFQHSETHFETGIDSTSHANGLGVSLLYDTRNNVYAPVKGWRVGISYLDNATWMGSDENFQSIRAYANYYRSINENMVLASRVSIFIGLGNVPFAGQHTVGGKDIRGYNDGKYRADEVYAIQTEYRWNFYKRWGAVGFFGVAFTEMPSSGALPGGGAGIRFRAIPSRNINIGIDYAKGKGDDGIYFRINEAF